MLTLLDFLSGGSMGRLNFHCASGSIYMLIILSTPLLDVIHCFFFVSPFCFPIFSSPHHAGRVLQSPGAQWNGCYQHWQLGLDPSSCSGISFFLGSPSIASDNLELFASLWACSWPSAVCLDWISSEVRRSCWKWKLSACWCSVQVLFACSGRMLQQQDFASGLNSVFRLNISQQHQWQWFTHTNPGGTSHVKPLHTIPYPYSQDIFHWISKPTCDLRVQSAVSEYPLQEDNPAIFPLPTEKLGIFEYQAHPGAFLLEARRKETKEKAT